MLKIIVLNISKYMGLFLLTKYIFKNKLLILCYHGFEIKDESEFRPQLFLKKTTLERRLKILKKSGNRVLTLDKAVKALKSNSVPENSVVITVDDGFYSVFSIAYPIFQKYQYPITIYQITYDAKMQLPVNNLLIHYFIFSAPQAYYNFEQIDWLEIDKFDLNIKSDRDWLIGFYLSKINKMKNRLEKDQFNFKIAELLNVDYEKIKSERILSLLNKDEIKLMANNGVDFQLHTHTHKFPYDNLEAADNEIIRNRKALSEVVQTSGKHFCYPSGLWNKLHWPILKQHGIKSATTCHPGLNDSSSNPLILNRFLDDETVPDIVFEAEIYRFNEVLRLFKEL